MKGSCHKCGAPLKKGNIQVIRKPGKRPRRECRRCPQVVKAGPITAAAFNEELAKPFPGGDTAGDGLQRPQETTGGPYTATVVLDYSDPPRYRYFMTRDQAEKVKASVERNASFGFGIAFEVIPVLEHLVDQDPDAYADLVEVTIDWKVE